MPLMIDAPNTLLLGIWLADDRAAITGALRDECGGAVPDALQLAGEPWITIAQALVQAELIDVRHVVILTNDAALVGALSPPFKAPAPDRYERVWYSRTDWVDVGVGGDAAHWQVLCDLGGRWGGRFRVELVADLPKARELWQHSQSKTL